MDSSDVESVTPFPWAARKGQEVIVQLLLGTGLVNVNSRDFFDQTSSYWAEQNGNEAVVKLRLTLRHFSNSFLFQKKKIQLQTPSYLRNVAIISP